MMYIQCEWLNSPSSVSGRQCANKGVYVILYGCLQLHTAEIIFCAQHATDWEEMAAETKAFCPNNYCSNYVDLFTRVNIEAVTYTWLQRRLSKSLPNTK